MRFPFTKMYSGKVKFKCDTHRKIILPWPCNLHERWSYNSANKKGAHLCSVCIICMEKSIVFFGNGYPIRVMNTFVSRSRAENFKLFRSNYILLSDNIKYLYFTNKIIITLSDEVENAKSFEMAFSPVLNDINWSWYFRDSFINVTVCLARGKKTI